MSSNGFKERNFQPPLVQHKELKCESYDDPSLGDLDDAKYDWEYFGFDKYGRYAVCKNTKIKRSLTMGEFYGAGIVD